MVTQKPSGTRIPSIRDSSPRLAPLPPANASFVLSICSKPNTYSAIDASPRVTLPHRAAALDLVCHADPASVTYAPSTM